jgi:hypothetical protein
MAARPAGIPGSSISSHFCAAYWGVPQRFPQRFDFLIARQRAVLAIKKSTFQEATFQESSTFLKYILKIFFGRLAAVKMTPKIRFGRKTPSKGWNYSA